LTSLRIFWFVSQLLTVIVAAMVYRSIEKRKSAGDKEYEKVIEVKKAPSFADPQAAG
jgi:hypothetical protein